MSRGAGDPLGAGRPKDTVSACMGPRRREAPSSTSRREAAAHGQGVTRPRAPCAGSRLDDREAGTGRDCPWPGLRVFRLLPRALSPRPRRPGVRSPGSALSDWAPGGAPTAPCRPRPPCAPYLRLLLLHPQDPGGDLDGGQRLRVAGGRGRDVRDHGGAAVQVAQRLPQQHGELALPAGPSGRAALASRPSGCDFRPPHGVFFFCYCCCGQCLFLSFFFNGMLINFIV